MRVKIIGMERHPQRVFFGLTLVCVILSLSSERQSERTGAKGELVKSNWKASGRLQLHALFGSSILLVPCGGLVVGLADHEPKYWRDGDKTYGAE
jgi:hypothetical protein